MEFAERLKTLRKQVKLTQTQIAEKLNISQQAYASWERGVKKTSKEKVKKLEQILNVQKGYFTENEIVRETGFDYDGAVYAVVCNSQTYIKRVYREEHGLKLVSINPKYRDIFLSYDEDPRIVGIIVGNFVPIKL